MSGLSDVLGKLKNKGINVEFDGVQESKEKDVKPDNNIFQEEQAEIVKEAEIVEEKPKKKKVKNIKKETTKEVENKIKEENVMSNSLMVIDEKFKALANVEAGQDLVLLGSDEAVKEALTMDNFLPRRFLKVLKTGVNKAEIGFGKDENFTPLNEPVFLLTAHVWRALSNPDGIGYQCVSPDGKIPAVGENTMNETCEGCPAKGSCKLNITYFFASPNYDGVYILTLRSGSFNWNERINLTKTGWYELTADLMKHKNYAPFGVLKVKSYDGEVEQIANLQGKYAIIREHLLNFFENPFGKKDEE